MKSAGKVMGRKGSQRLAAVPKLGKFLNLNQ